MKQRKNLPYLPLFIDDWMQSSGLCDCSDATRGIYADLLCVLFKERVRGTYSLHVREMTWKNSRSKTRTALGKPTAEGRLPYFIDFLVKPLRSKPKAILKALRELLYNEVIDVRGDTLIQPRMFRDYGGSLPDVEGVDDDPQFSLNALLEAEDTTVNNGAKKGAKKSTKNDTKKAPKKSAKNDESLHASARIPFENGNGIDNNNIKDNNSIGIIGGTGDENRDNVKNTNNNPDDGGEGKKGGSKREKSGGGAVIPPEGQKRADSPRNGSDGDSGGGVTTIDGRPIDTGETEGPLFSEFWEAYDKNVNMIEAETIWGVLSVKDREAIMAYIPLYKQAQPRKFFRKNPVTFLRNRAWEDELIRENEPINNKGYNNEGSTDNRRGAAGGTRGNQKQDNDDMREQTVRIVQRLRANRQASQSDESDTGGADE